MSSWKKADSHPRGCHTTLPPWPARGRTMVCLAALGLSTATWGASSPPGGPANAVNSANHYRDSGLGPATGRAGNATLSARALLDKSGNTLVELTTGALDTANKPPGNLDKVQYKPFDPNGNAYFSQNFTGLTGGGYYQFTTNGVQRSQQMQLQANVSGIDKRTDVVTVVETVKLRPDIAVKRLSNPALAYVNKPVVITATVRELNGDAGANADCVLSVNDAVVDTGSSIWVDANGVVSCAFAYPFPSAGNYQLKVSASNVVPGDWDSSNNAATGVIDIVNLESVKLSGWATYWHDDFTHSAIETSTVYQNDALFANSQNTWSESGWSEYSWISANTFGSKPMQMPVTVNYQESADGIVTDTGSGAITAYYFSTGQDGSNTCSNGSTSGQAGNVWLWAISSGCVDPAGQVLWSFSYVDAWRPGGDVTYLSNGYQCGSYWWWSGSGEPCSTGNYYTWNTSTKQQWGSHVSAGSQHAISLSLTGSDGTIYSADSGPFAIQSFQTTWGPYSESSSWGPDSWGFSGTFSRDNWTGTESASYGSTNF